MQSIGAPSRPWGRGGRAFSGQVLVGLAVAAVAAFLATVLNNRGALYGLAGAIVAFGCLWCATTRRTPLALALLMLYLGLLDGYLKLAVGSTQISLVRDALLYALVIGLLVRAQAEGRTMSLPPLSVWVVGFSVIILAQIANPHRGSLAHSLGGVRQHLEFVPLFFLAYTYVRSTLALRVFVVILLVAAAANGVVSYLQFNLSPAELAGWGPGYAKRINGTGGFEGAGRTFATTGGQQRVRPFGLGGDAGSGGILGALALAGGLALGSLVDRRRYQLLAVALTIGAAVAVLTSQGRGVVVCAVASVVAYGLLSATSQRRTAAIVGIVLAGATSYYVIDTIVSSQGSSAFRYEGLTPSKLLDTTGTARVNGLGAISDAVTQYPLGAGLAVAGPASGTVSGGTQLTGTINAESEFSFMTLEGGIPATLLLLGFVISIIALGIRFCRQEPDPEARVLLAAVIAPVIGTVALFYPSPVTPTVPTGPYLWTAGGIVAYWLVTRRRARAAGA